MPSAKNGSDLIAGKARPNETDRRHTDAISCYFCHTIAYVKKSHEHNINIPAKQAEGYKPTFYGRLHNPDDSDKHSSVKNPIYSKNVCLGCHSHKKNASGLTIFRAMQENQNSESCIKCHMPEVEGGVEKMDKRTRGHHASHRFPGIHDKAMRAKGVDINISRRGDELDITLLNKMDHPLIIQPARVKYLKIDIDRNGKTIWQNYKKHPSEDRQGYFAYSFKRNGKKVIIPATATEYGRVNNLDAKEKRTLRYKIPGLEKGDRVTVSLFVKLAKDDCLGVIDLEGSGLNDAILMKRYSKIIQ
jgi:hypothetical protein